MVRILIGGSSPLARGLPRRHRRRAGGLGIIPARAGFTSGCERLLARPGDHPRSRGVYSYPWSLAAQYGGSSPLARGLPGGRSPRPATPGIIPARAGFTRPHSPQRPRIQDHPRSRGVYPDGDRVVLRPDGSSPLARGLRRGDLMSPGRLRIIPARAGFTGEIQLLLGKPGDHPRSRGVYLVSPSPRRT